MRCIESTAYADMQQSLHYLRRRGYTVCFALSFFDSYQDRTEDVLPLSAS